ncbi:LPXTG cell wall anchor domain-containing protein [Rothia mucilaginosa]|uniref:LPXTG cell wall anchor domain-containing protein n=1 Tax=Rothia mucilaginosa TaxID=43675 RepID=UPI0026EFC260|nr:LPXTG cell wall anchor domain-containing protein [Rothia mucilaginosa]
MTSSPKPSRKLLAVASTLSVIAGSMTVIPASFAANGNSSLPAVSSAQNSNDECRHFSVSATQYQGLPGQYQLAYAPATSTLFTSFSSGRPPILTGGLGSWNVSSAPSLASVYQFPTVDFTPRGATEPSGKQIASPYGVGYDEATGYVWVTQTRTSTVSVVDPSTNQILWTSAAGDVNDPREVRIDTANGKAFVSGSGGLSVFDIATHALVKKIAFNDAKGEEDIAMNFHIDSADGKVYVPTLSAGTLKVVNSKTLEVEKTIELHKDKADIALNPTDVTIDKSLKEIYVSSQGDRKTGANSGVTVYDLETGAYKKSIPFGKQALAITSDEARDLLYVTDYGTGNVGVIDARTGAVVSEVSTGATSGANDVLVTPDGSAYAVARSTEDASPIETNYTIDKTTGEYRTSSTEPKGKDNADNPITPGVMVKLNTTVETTAKSASQASSEELVKTYADGAKLYTTKEWTKGETLKLRGEGFKTQDGKGSIVAVKLNKGKISAKEEPKLNGKEGNSAGVWAYIQADENGNFTAELPYPTTANSNLKDELNSGDQISVVLLSGSMAENDTPRGGEALKATVADQKVADTTCATVETSKVAAAPSGVTTQYPAGTPLATAKNDEPTPTPSNSAKPEPTTPAPSDSAKPEPTTPAPSDSATSNEVVHEYKDGAKVYFPKTWEGEKLTFRGEGFKTKDGKGSVIAVKLNKGTISAKEEPKLEGVEANSSGVWAYIKADENGNFTATIDRPTVANSNLKEELKTGDKVAIYLLSGSLTENDNARGGVAVEYTFTTENQPKKEEAKNASVTPSVPQPSAPADSKDQAKDQSNAPADSLKSENQKNDNGASKVATSSSQNISSSNGSDSSKSAKSSLANTGASGVLIASGLGVLALIAGASVLVARRRKA